MRLSFLGMVEDWTVFRTATSNLSYTELGTKFCQNYSVRMYGTSGTYGYCTFGQGENVRFGTQLGCGLMWKRALVFKTLQSQNTNSRDYQWTWGITLYFDNDHYYQFQFVAGVGSNLPFTSIDSYYKYASGSVVTETNIYAGCDAFENLVEIGFMIVKSSTGYIRLKPFLAFNNVVHEQPYTLPAMQLAFTNYVNPIFRIQYNCATFPNNPVDLWVSAVGQ